MLKRLASIASLGSRGGPGVRTTICGDPFFCWEDAGEHGQQSFVNYCAPCHGADGRAGARRSRAGSKARRI